MQGSCSELDSAFPMLLRGALVDSWSAPSLHLLLKKTSMIKEVWGRLVKSASGEDGLGCGSTFKILEYSVVKNELCLQAFYCSKMHRM